MHRKNHRKIIENRLKIEKKPKKNATARKTLPETLPEAAFSAKSQFLVDFWDPAGSQNGVQDAPGTLLNRHGSSPRFEKRPDRLPGGPGEAPGHPQGPSRDPPGTPRGLFWIDFWSIFKLHFQMKNCDEIIIFFAIFRLTFRVDSWLWLGRPRNTL